MTYQIPTGRPLADDRVLCIKDVCDIMGFCPQVASDFIKESGYGIVIHRRVFILESNLLKYLHSLEAAE